VGVVEKHWVGAIRCIALLRIADRSGVCSMHLGIERAARAGLYGGIVYGPDAVAGDEVWC
jgi:hypothetical protein